MSLLHITCLETGDQYGYVASTPYEALKKHIYTMNLSHQDNTADIKITKSVLHLYTVHHGKTYAIRNQ